MNGRLRRPLLLSALLLVLTAVVVSICPLHLVEAASASAALMASSPAQTQPAITSPEYKDQLQAALSSLANRRDADARSVASNLRMIGAVLLPDGTEMHPDLSRVAEWLEARPPDYTSAEASLRTLLSEMSAQPAWSGADDARARLLGILDRPEFRTKPRQNPVQEQLGRLWVSFLEWLLVLLGPVASLLPAWDFSALWIVLGLLGLGGLVLMAVLVVGSLRRAMGPEVKSLPPELQPPAADAQSMRFQAQQMAQSGDFRGAVRALYLAVLLKWDELGRLRFDRALTNREVLVQAEASENRDASVERLAPLVERFDRYWYGAVSCTADDYADFARLATAAMETP